MKRIDYHVGRAERWTGVDLGSLIAPALRIPLAVLACAFALVGVAGSAEQMRLRAAEADGAECARRLAAIDLDLARVRAVERDVARLQTLRARTEEIGRSGPVHAGEIAELGNGVPPGAWLTSLHNDVTGLTIEGGARGLDVVASTLSSLANLPAYTDARLLSVHRDPVREGVTYALALESRR